MSAAGPPGPAVEPFGPERLDAAAALLAARHRRARRREPALDGRHTTRAACVSLLRRARDDGARCGRPPRRCGGGLSAGPDRPPSGVRRADPSDIDALEPPRGLVNAAHTAPPVFAFADQPMWDVLRSGHPELLSDPEVAYWVAEGSGGVDGFIVMRPVPAGESSLLKPQGSLELLLAATAPHARGSGVGTLLTRWALTDAARRGFTVCATDWRAANPLASVFWPHRGFRPAAHRLHRILGPRLTGPEHITGP
ncbi:GNAT family N-acetyltransferase [Streptomyces sp. NA02950]|uniref:GNAT family N-acetyltransferase n=1 Tax=Streptomyces sp. NA02950 TaxID=2742137 RepID=UPI0015920885|nr:GNAT family N-acetyltransferase [Streptomyces sp. NA02950]QKV96859.1 GNAT family N-acetyltransferase [Streptomyces sp. NA02950]